MFVFQCSLVYLKKKKKNSPHFINYWTKHEETKTNIQTHPFTHTLIQNVQSLENHTVVIIILKIFPFLVMRTC